MQFKILIHTITVCYYYLILFSFSWCIHVIQCWNSAISSCLEIGIVSKKSQRLLPLSPVEALWTQQLMAHRSFSSSESSDSLVPLGVCWVWESSGCCGDSAPFRLHRTAMVPLKSTTASHNCPAHKRSYEPFNLARRTINNSLIIMFCFFFYTTPNRHSSYCTYLAYAFSNSATQNALGLWHLEKQRVSLIQGSRSSTRTSIQCPFCQNWNRNSPR